jgi:hypothetical protein
LEIAPASLRLCLKAAGHAERRHQLHNERHDTDTPEMRRSRMARPATCDKPQNTLTKIKRIGPRHRKSPQTPSESRKRPIRNPHRFSQNHPLL